MGEVYHATDTMLNKEVALKILRKGMAGDKTLIKRFAREVQALGKVSHPNVVQIYDYHEAKGHHYYTMEYIDGVSLKDVLDESRPSLRQSAEIIRQLADGVAAAHEIGIIHRDLKPANIIITPKHEVKLLDFGLAKFEDCKGTLGTLTATGQIVGTLKYITPETVRGEEATRQSDVFQMGIVLYEMLTGFHPFADASLPDLLRGDALLAIEAPADVKDEMDSTLSWYTMRMLSLRPGERPTTKEVRDDFTRWLSDQPLDSSERPLPYSSRRVKLGVKKEKKANPLQRAGQAKGVQVGGSRRSLIITGLIVILLLMGLVWSRRQKHSSPAEPKVTKNPTVTAKGPRMARELFEGFYNNLNDEQFRARTNQLQAHRERDLAGLSLLHVAALRGLVKEIETLLLCGADVHVRDRWNCTPLHYAARYGQVDVAQLLLKKGAKANERDSFLRTPLHHLILLNSRRLGETLIKGGANLDARDKTGRTALHLCAERGDGYLASLLIDKGANLNMTDYRGRTPLHRAASWHSKSLPKLFRSAGADFSILDDRGFRAFDYASPELSELYRFGKVNNDQKANLRSVTPLHAATVLKDIAALRSLLSRKGLRLNVRDNKGRTPLHCAAMEKSRGEVAALLIEKGARVNIRDERDDTPLHYAARSRATEIARKLLDSGAQVDALDGNKRTPLHLAAYLGDMKMCQLLLEKGASTKARDWDGESPLHRAAWSGARDVVELLSNEEASLDAKDDQGWTPLFMAVAANHEGLVSLLIKRGADLNARSAMGVTPLFWANRLQGRKEVAKVIIKLGGRE